MYNFRVLNPDDVHIVNIWTNSISNVNAKNDNLYTNLFIKIGFKAVGCRVLFLE